MICRTVVHQPVLRDSPAFLEKEYVLLKYFNSDGKKPFFIPGVPEKRSADYFQIRSKDDAECDIYDYVVDCNDLSTKITDIFKHSWVMTKSNERPTCLEFKDAAVSFISGYFYPFMLLSLLSQVTFILTLKGS
eukprot:GHVR01155097.1.p1 GENE.GHVR01155097.1~~GHVR01155097.1.p1  ORF type:complete len:133 (+),score=9.41 GHVR01155097.1:230-628(+)